MPGDSSFPARTFAITRAADAAGENLLVNLDPAVGAEANRRRPELVISNDTHPDTEVADGHGLRSGH